MDIVVGEGTADKAKELMRGQMDTVMGEGTAENAKEQANKWMQWYTQSGSESTQDKK